MQRSIPEHQPHSILDSVQRSSPYLLDKKSRLLGRLFYFKRLNRHWSESNELLGNRLNIYHIHSATPDSGVLENKDVLNKLRELRSSEAVIGLTLSGANQAETLQKALTIKHEADPLFQSVQVTWNVLERSATDALVTASQSGIGIIVKRLLQTAD